MSEDKTTENGAVIKQDLNDPEIWAEWILAQEDKNSRGVKRTPAQIAEWIAGQVGGTDKTVALLNRIPFEKLPMEERIKLIEQSCLLTNSNPQYRVPRRGNLTHEGIRPGQYGFIELKAESFFPKLKGHPLYQPPKEIPAESVPAVKRIAA